MFIKAITIEGFKSYGHKVEIAGFDPFFNAITGLNGSGKSNILDAICFVMGISNLSQVRAGTLQELIYKNGQAGIKKAVVSITFDNSDKDQSPVGYESCKDIVITRQITIGAGRNRYTINGTAAQNNKVQDLLCSVQMNVNNPHFLIMQGRITKVLNMKPPEILSIIEEAAGTSLFENKKINAQKTFVKKDAKLEEINTTLTELIRPTLHKLHNERKVYSEYTKHVRQIERLTKLQTAWEFIKSEEICNNSESALSNVYTLIAESKDIIKSNQDMINIITVQLENLEKKKTEETTVQLKDLDAVYKKKQLEEVKANSDLKHRNDSLSEIIRNQRDIIKNMEEDSKNVKEKEKELEPISHLVQQLKAKAKNDSEDSKAAIKCYQDVSVGMSTNDEGQTATLAEQLMKAKTQSSTLDLESKKAEIIWNHCQKELNKKFAESKKSEKNYKKEQEKYFTLEKDLANLREQLDHYPYSETKMQNLITDTKNLQEEIDNFYFKYPKTFFEYKDPKPKFDHSTVKGMICNLFTLKEPKAALALEVAASNRLFNVVVDNANISQDLVQKGQLKYRSTFIPLKEIRSTPISPHKIRLAKELVGEDNVHSPLSLIQYDPALESAMQFVFGNVLICTDYKSANSVAFCEKIQVKCVTLDGDVYNPAGILSGGFRDSQGGSLLSCIPKHIENMNMLQNQKKELAELETQQSGFYALQNKFEFHKRQANLCQESLKYTSHYASLKDIEQLQKDIENQKKIIGQNKDKKINMDKKIQDLESKMKNFKEFREMELKNVKEKMKRAKLKADQSSNLYNEQKNESENLELELEELKKSLDSNEKVLSHVNKQRNETEKLVEVEAKVLERLRNQVCASSTELRDKKLELKAINEDIQRLYRKKNKLTRSIEEKSLQIQQSKHDISKIQEESKQAQLKRNQFFEDNDWIRQDRQYFGMAGTQYDFEIYKPKEIAEMLAKHLEAKAELSKNINMKAHSMLDQANSQCQELTKKKRIVENDRAKIAKLIQQLDEKKKIALNEAWIKVNKDFGSIFGTLIPGTDAKLVPLEGQSFLSGLEVKVALGGAWKDSLSELSGGQRSLVALSLILALLLFKAAPIYILDEVDAALDPSHTQNIGLMLREHFKKSQFIIVSLKDGMFKNANVLYKTTFIDGMSTVFRSIQKHE